MKFALILLRNIFQMNFRNEIILRCHSKQQLLAVLTKYSSEKSSEIRSCNSVLSKSGASVKFLKRDSFSLKSFKKFCIQTVKLTLFVLISSLPFPNSWWRIHVVSDFITFSEKWRRRMSKSNVRITVTKSDNKSSEILRKIASHYLWNVRRHFDFTATSCCQFDEAQESRVLRQS